MIARQISILASFTLCSVIVVHAETQVTIPITSTEQQIQHEQERMQARERELVAGEDRLAAQREENVERAEEEDPTGIDWYASARVRYRQFDHNSVWGDGGSRVGVEGQWQYKPKFYLFGRAELGFNLLDSIDSFLDPKGRPRNEDDDVSLRVGYLGIETPNNIALVGKNWSTYYAVAGFTDRFEAGGGNASGTYNASTDGGETGTGRADKVIQTRFYTSDFDFLYLKPFNINVQYQPGNNIPHAENNISYDYSFGLSAVMETVNDIKLGLAYNKGAVKSEDLTELRKIGISGDAEAILIGTRWFGKGWYLGTTASRLKNHETTEENIYFDGVGWEVYGQYQIYDPWWLTAGWNYLDPDDNEHQTGQYQIKYGLFGLRYSIDGFRRMLYANIRIDDGSKFDGSGFGDVYTIGVRWDFPE